MAANTSPIFPVTPNVGFAKVTSAVTTTDGTDANAVLLFTAGSNGARVEEIDLWFLGQQVTTVVRIWINNGSTHTSATNNTLWQEVTLTGTAALSQVAASTPVVLKPKNLYLKPNYTLYVAVGTAVSAGVQATALGGDY